MATSYSNHGGTGVRAGYILITTSASLLSGPPWHFVDGDSISNGQLFFNAVALSGAVFIKFDFRTNRIIDEAKFYQQLTTSHGIWKWQGSTDDISYFDIGSSFTLGGIATQTQTALNGNTTAYRYYKLVGVSGSSATAPYVYEFEFQIDPETTVAQSYANAGGEGNRSASITVSATQSIGGGSVATLVNGNMVEQTLFFTNGAAVAGNNVRFDFGSARKVTEATWFQNQTGSHGTWKWQGSANATTWTDIGASFTLGGSIAQIQTQLSGNAATYRYYQLLGVSGTASFSPYLYEIAFQTDSGLTVLSILTTTLPTAEMAVAYSQTITTTGGIGAITFSVSSGVLPAGLSLDTATGVISGTPTNRGSFATFEITATDTAANADTQAYTVFTDDPLCVPQAIGALIRGVFTNNSRVGPHQNEGKSIAVILRDADNAKKLTANYSTNNGITWSQVSIMALFNDIASHDSHKVAASDTIHVWTQESTTGRVAYHTFDLATGLWTLENQQVSASEILTVSGGAVSGTVLSPSGDPALVYESTLETIPVLGNPHNRMTYKRRTAGVWAAALPMGNIGLTKADTFGRLIAGNNNRSTMIFRMDDGTATPEFQMQVVQAAGTLSSVFTFRSTGLLGTSPVFYVGDYTTYTSGTNLILVVPVKFGGEPTIFSFIDSDTPAIAQGEPVLGDNVGQGPFVPIVARYVAGALHFLDFAWPGLSSDSFICYKTSTSYLGPFTPSGSMTDQVGPLMGTITSNAQTMDGNFVVRTCNDVDSVYLATVVPIGIVASVTNTIKFEWLKVDDLPSSPTLSLTQWLTDLATQTIDYCCTQVPPVPLTTCECETHNGRIYRMAMDLYTDDGCTIRRLRRTPHISEEQARMIHHLLQVDVEVGKGLVTGQGNDPQVMLRFSDDGGITWSNERWESAGKLGEFRQRVMFRRLGQSRDRLYELVVTDPVKWAIVSGYLDISAGFK